MNLVTKLRHYASQENCDGEEYDAMQDAADRIAELEAKVKRYNEIYHRQRESMAELEAENARLQGELSDAIHGKKFAQKVNVNRSYEVEALTERAEKAEAIVERVRGFVDGESRMKDGKPVCLGKTEQCDHGQYSWNACDCCTDEILTAAIGDDHD